ncbi:MAG: NUDIX hydrolase [Patescibacteria group bacterium]
MKKVVLNFEIDRPFGNLLRPRHALIACRDSDGFFILGKKDSYPGFSRFAGGGVDEGEEPRHAAARELEEELGVCLPESDFVELFEIEAHAKGLEDEYRTQIFVYFVELQTNEVVPQDDLDGIERLRLAQFPDLVKKYESFSPDFRSSGGNKGDDGFRWLDYGKLYGPVHRIAHDEIVERHL